MSERFKVIEGGSTPRQFRRPDDELEPLLCPVCDAWDAIEIVKPYERDGDIDTSRRILACARCYAKDGTVVALGGD